VPRSVSLPEIVAYVAAQPAVAALLSTRVFVGEPISDQQAGTYLCVNAVTQTRGEVECSARVELRFCAHDEKTSKKALVDAQDAVCRVLATGGPLKMGTFVANHVEEGSDFFLARDDKNRNVLVRDIVVRFTWSQ
jgi:hypothetical protein